MDAFGKYYYILSKFNGLVLDIEHRSDDPGTPVIMWEKKDNMPDNQLWYDDFDTLTIRSKQNDLCLTVKDGELCIDEYEDDNEDQKWFFRRGHGTIQNGYDRNSVLDIAECSTEPGAKVIAWEEHGADNQLWECERVSCRYYFMIRSRMNGLVMDLKRKSDKDGTKVIMKDPEGDEDNQLWWEDENNVIRSKLTGFALQTEDNEDGDIIRCYPFDEGNEGQYWMRTPRGVIINRFTPDKALDIKGKSDDEGTNVIMWERHGEENQQWDFVYQ